MPARRQPLFAHVKPAALAIVLIFGPVPMALGQGNTNQPAPGTGSGDVSNDAVTAGAGTQGDVTTGSSNAHSADRPIPGLVVGQQGIGAGAGSSGAAVPGGSAGTAGALPNRQSSSRQSPSRQTQSQAIGAACAAITDPRARAACLDGRSPR